MSKAPDLASYEFTVHTIAPVGMSMEVHRVTASYFQEERSYTLFKDACHAVVAAHKTDFVAQVVRADEPVVDAV